MLVEKIPNDDLVEWSEIFIKEAMDRPWFHATPPMVALDVYELKCRCGKKIKLERHSCEDNAGWVYLGQCSHCETIIWSYKEAEESWK